jgi:pimeloyl-ACP methyl ester carboxylesterase
MKAGTHKQYYCLVACVIVVAICALFAYGVERDFGRLDVKRVAFSTEEGPRMVAKLYRHKEATVENPMPGVLALHGYQNDKETAGAVALELARRGFVVLAIDHLGHGSSGGHIDWETASGANSGYQYLKGLPFVDAENLGILGHSMGAINTIILGELNPDHRALNPQCGTAGGADLHNVLLTQARYEEFGVFRENEFLVEPLRDHAVRIEAFGLEAGPVEWNTTYGEFADGTARRADLLDTVHPGITHSAKAVAGTVSWMRQALKGDRYDAYWIPETDQIFKWKELCMLAALLTTFASMMFLANTLMSNRLFRSVAGPLPGRHVAVGRDWWIPAMVNVVIAGVTYPPLTTLGGIFGKLITWVPFLKMQITNGVMVWFLVNAAIYVVIFTFWYRKNSTARGITMYDMGVSFDEDKTVFDWGILGKTAVLGVILFAWMYFLEGISEWVLGIEFRFWWPFMRQFSPERFGYFWVYLIPALLFFLLNGGVFLFGQIRQKEYESPTKTQLVWWAKNCLTALLGLVAVWIVQYVPFFLGVGPGFEVIGMPGYSEMWPLMLFVFVPEFAVILFFVTWFYRRTGKIYLGALMGSALAIWFSTAGTVIAG